MLSEPWPPPLAPVQAFILERLSALRTSQLSMQCQVATQPLVNLTIPDVELGYELYQHVPRAFRLCREGRLAALSICVGRHPFYYFVPRRMVYQRECRDAFGKERNQNFAAQHSPTTASANTYPPYRTAFQLPAAPPFAYIFNKLNSEWGGPPVNTWRAPDVRVACERLGASAEHVGKAGCYPHVLYYRSRNMASMGTGSRQWGDDDLEAARRAGGVVVGDWLQHVVAGRSSHSGDTAPRSDRWDGARVLELVNVAQLVLLSTASLSVGVQGGMAVLSGLVGGRVLLLCRRGIECEHDYTWYPRIANASIAVMRSAADAIALATWHCASAPVAMSGHVAAPPSEASDAALRDKLYGHSKRSGRRATSAAGVGRSSNGGYVHGVAHGPTSHSHELGRSRGGSGLPPDGAAGGGALRGGGSTLASRLAVSSLAPTGSRHASRATTRDAASRSQAKVAHPLSHLSATPRPIGPSTRPSTQSSRLTRPMSASWPAVTSASSSSTSVLSGGGGASALGETSSTVTGRPGALSTTRGRSLHLAEAIIDSSDLIVGGETGFLRALATTRVQTLESLGLVVWAERCALHPPVIDLPRRVLCAWLDAAASRSPRCPHLLIALGDENFGPLDPASRIAYGGAYRGCRSWQRDADALERLLAEPMTLGLVYRQTPPIHHPKIHLVPLGPSRAFVSALLDEPPVAAAPPHATRSAHFVARSYVDAEAQTTSTTNRSSGSMAAASSDEVNARAILFYVNHSPTPTRTAVFETVRRNFDGALTNEYCHRPFVTDAQCPSWQRSRTCETRYRQRYCAMPASTYLRKLRDSVYAVSPAGMGEDCYRHYEIMLAGAFPVVRRSLSYRVFGNAEPSTLPHAAVDDWRNVTPAWLRQTLPTLATREWSFERLTKAYWARLVARLKEEGSPPALAFASADDRSRRARSPPRSSFESDFG